MKWTKARKMTVLLTLVLVMLTSCSLLPTTITDALTGESTAASDGEMVTISKEEYERLKQYEELDEIKRIVDQYYYQEPDEEGMLEGAAWACFTVWTIPTPSITPRRIMPRCGRTTRATTPA